MRFFAAGYVCRYRQDHVFAGGDGLFNKSEVTPLYYETTLKSKRLLDESSEEMLDIIFSNRIIDLANIFNWDDCIQYYNQMIMGAGNAVVSFMESRESRMQEGIDQTVELFRDLK